MVAATSITTRATGVAIEGSDGHTIIATLHNVKPAIPVLTEQTPEHYINSVARGLAEEIAKTGQLTERGYVIGGFNADQMVSNITAAGNGHLADQSRTGDKVTPSWTSPTRATVRTASMS